MNEATTRKNGIKEYNSYSECSLIVSKIINAYGGDAGAAGFYMPQIPGMGTADLELNKSEILNVKSKDNELYNVIRNILNIDDSKYQSLTSLRFNVTCVNQDEYSVVRVKDWIINDDSLSGKFGYWVNEVIHGKK